MTYTRQEAASVLGISLSALNAAIRLGKVPVLDVGIRRVLILKSELHALLKTGELDAPDGKAK
jgi:excisionase family DNA binding protein